VVHGSFVPSLCHCCCGLLLLLLLLLLLPQQEGIKRVKAAAQ
jgi:hypothetical protein